MAHLTEDFVTESMPAITLGQIGPPSLGQDPQGPTDRLSQTLGHTFNPDNSLLTDRSLNLIKNRIFGHAAPQSLTTVTWLAVAARQAQGNDVQGAINRMFASIREVS